MQDQRIKNHCKNHIGNIHIFTLHFLSLNWSSRSGSLNWSSWESRVLAKPALSQGNVCFQFIYPAFFMHSLSLLLETRICVIFLFRFMYDSFDNTYQATIGIDFLSKTMYLEVTKLICLKVSTSVPLSIFSQTAELQNQKVGCVQICALRNSI